MSRAASKKIKRRRRRLREAAAPVMAARVGASPGTLEISEDALAPRVEIHWWTPETVHQRVFERGTSANAVGEQLAAIVGEARSAGQTIWIDVEGVGDPAFFEGLGALLGLHPLSLEDLVHIDARPKCEIYPEYTLLISRQLQDRDEGPEDALVGIVVFPDLVLSVRHCEDSPFRQVERRLQVPEGRLRRSKGGYLGYVLLDAVVDGWSPIVDRLLGEAEALEDEILESPDPSDLARHAELKRRVVLCRNALRPLLETIGPLLRGDSPAFEGVATAYLRDVQDHAFQSLEGVEATRELLISAISAYQSAIAQKTNEIMKVLAVVSTVFVPLTFLVGVWGMNFEHMPELSWRYGYFLALGLMLVVGGGIVMIFRLRGWLSFRRDIVPGAERGGQGR
jgi:magnesium transporter